MSDHPKISVCIITLNEGDNLSECLASVKWADEIVLVDSGSTDNTLDTAGAFGCRIISQEFLGHVKQKDLAVRSASNDWVLCLDADERLADGGEEEVRGALSNAENRDITGYYFPRHTFYLGAWIDHSGWWPEYRLRLFNREKGGWTGIDPHDRVEVKGNLKKLKTEIAHFNYRDLSHHMEKVNAYTTIMADRRFKAGQKPSLLKMIFSPPIRFLKMYVLKHGFLDGRRGFVLAFIGAFYVFMKYAKLWERHNTKKM